MTASSKNEDVGTDRGFLNQWGRFRRQAAKVIALRIAKARAGNLGDVAP